MPKLRRVAKVRSAKSVAIRVACKLGGRKSKVSVKGLSTEALLKEATNMKRARDKHKIITEMRARGVSLPAEPTETI